MTKSQNHSSLIERMKTMLIVVLTLSTILLLYFFWKDSSTDHSFELSPVVAILMGEELHVPSVEDVVVPQEIMVNFKYQSGNYTVVDTGKEKYWKKAVEELGQFSNENNIQVKEIPKDQYDQIMEFRSIQFTFSYDIPFAEFCDRFQIRRFQGSDAVQYLSSMGYCADKNDSLFFYDRKNNKYYRMFVDKSKEKWKNGFDEMLDKIENGGDYVHYLPASSYMLGTDEKDPENNAFMPLHFTSNLRAFTYAPEFKPGETDKINNLAETFYGKNFDFIRRLTESQGTMIFMYGYGQKVLIAGIDGTLEYKEEASDDTGEQSFFGAMDTALKFVASHGSWYIDEGAKEDPQVILKSATLQKDKMKTYRFAFDIALGDHPICIQNGYAVVIEVTGNQVTYYKRNMMRVNSAEVLRNLKMEEETETVDAVNTIALNYDYISKFLMKQGIISASTSSGKDDQKTPYLKDIVDAMSSIQTGYVKDQTSDKVVPAWIVNFSNKDNTKKCNLYFNLYRKAKAEPIGYNGANGRKSSIK